LNVHTKTDNELVKQFVGGDASSIEVLINRHKDRVFSYILISTRNKELAEDIFQDTFIKVIKSLLQGKYKDNGKFVSWVVRIAHNLIIDHYRKSSQVSFTSNDDYDFDLLNSKDLIEQNIEEEMVNEQVLKEIKLLIEELPDDQREVIMLRHYGGLSFKEIAEQTNVSINTALGRMRYAVINMRKLIKEKKLSLT
jgi:RNA polymerase sigma factor (sigma-70 family)